MSFFNKNEGCIYITCSALLALLCDLPWPAVITKNLRKDSSANYRKHPTHRDVYLDGFWVGTPERVVIGQSYALHFKPSEKILYLGVYDGLEQCVHDDRFSLLVKEVSVFYIEDYGSGSDCAKNLNKILRQPGPVTYSYYYPDNYGSYGISISDNEGYERAAVYAWVKRRVEQAKFRQRVFQKHGAKCKVSGCTAERILDAAHLPGREWQKGHFSADDGIPLRADLHRALDAKMIRLDSQHQLEWVSPELEDTYGQYLISMG